MTDTARLTARQTNRLITALRHGQALDLAAADLALGLPSVWATARTDTRLTIALAGRDPDAPQEHGRTLRADFLRLLALGVPPSRAELILGSTSFNGWRGTIQRSRVPVTRSATPQRRTGTRGRSDSRPRGWAGSWKHWASRRRPLWRPPQRPA
ncbi:hypothetical protein ID867_15415 [Streptomyces parvulus]|nr:hypothetical protein [Streptomyces parvulus]